jgi:hypothetical protein
MAMFIFSCILIAFSMLLAIPAGRNIYQFLVKNCGEYWSNRAWIDNIMEEVARVFLAGAVFGAAISILF